MELCDRVDAVMAKHVTADGPGAVIGILKDGNFVHRKAYGLADLEWDTPLVPEAVFRIASVTKQFTAVAIMMLKERGLLALDASISAYLPGFPLRGREVTVRQLLNHTSGIKSYSDVPEFMREKSRLHLSLPKLIDLIKDQPFDFEPGERHLYNNSGYVLLGAIIERLGGCKYRDFLKHEIFEPLGMASTCYLFDEMIVGKRAYGYWHTTRGIEHVPPMSMTWPSAAGGLGSTVDDLRLWDRAIREHRLISKTSFELMLEPTKLGDGSIFPYGLGWGTGSYLGRRLYHHLGGLPGFSSQMTQFLDEDMTIILLANRSLFPVTTVTCALARCAFKVDDPPELFVRMRRQDLERFAGTYRLLNRSGGIERKLVVANEGLQFAEPDPISLIPIGEDCFRESSDPEVIYRFREERSGRLTGFTMELPTLPPNIYERVDA
jgi:CubicO group peptidase (beta-lactamase class C family)